MIDGFDPPVQPGANTLAPLELEAAAIDQARAAPAPDAPESAAMPAAAADPEGDARDVIEFAHAALVPLYPSLERVYTPDVRARLAAATARLLVKYDVSILALAAAWEPELKFAMVALPLIVPTVQAVRADRAAAQQDTRSAGSTPGASSAAQAAPSSPADAELANPLSRFGQAPGQTEH